MPEPWTLGELIASGWTARDLEWEEVSQGVLAALVAGERVDARAACGQALRIARGAFVASDPRLATSLANQAAAVADSGTPDQTGRLVAEAVRIWTASDAWISEMRAPRAARSSLFHLRMEQRHRVTYEERWRAKWRELAAEARAFICRPPGGFASPSEAGDRLERWRRDCPPILDDGRKLMAAAILLATGSGTVEDS